MALPTSANRDNSQASLSEQKSRGTYKCHEQQMTNPRNQSYTQGSHGQNHNTKDNERSPAGFSLQKLCVPERKILYK